MSIAEIHFVPHTRELSGTGIARLDRMAMMLDTYGGTVRYETDVTDEAFVQKRLDHVHEYLATTGCDMSRVEVKAMISAEKPLEALIVAIPESSGSALYGMLDVLSVTGNIWQTLSRTGGEQNLIRPRIVAMTTEHFHCGNGVPPSNTGGSPLVKTKGFSRDSSSAPTP